MEEWVRVQNERDRKVLVWLRGQVGDTAIAAVAHACARGDSKPYLSAVCRQLGLSIPRHISHGVSNEAVGEKHLAAMYEILARVYPPCTRADDLNALRHVSDALSALFQELALPDHGVPKIGILL
jgi:hypothetical protein